MVGLALGGITPALMLLALGPTRAAAGIRPSHLARIAVYAQLPLFYTLSSHAFSMLVGIDGSVDGGVALGRGFYTWWGRIGRAEMYGSAAWLLLWWYFAVSRGLRPPHARQLGALASLVALLTLLILVLGYWRWWYFSFYA
jgi:hypothetical protein